MRENLSTELPAELLKQPGVGDHGQGLITLWPAHVLRDDIVTVGNSLAFAERVSARTSIDAGLCLLTLDIDLDQDACFGHASLIMQCRSAEV